VAMLLGLAPDGGWFMYTPLTSRPFSPGINADVWLIGITFVEISAIAIGVELAATILKIRAAGMKLNRMPPFAWAMLVTAFMILAGFPPLIAGSILLELERAFDWPFFLAERGGDPLLWQHLFWLFGHPEVYIIFLPGAAIVSTMIPVFARHRLVGYEALVIGFMALGFLSLLLWVHHMFTVGIPGTALAFFSAASMLVAVPTAVQFAVWIATLWSGRPKPQLPMLYLFGFLAVFVFGGLTGVMLALVPFDWQAHDTHFVVAHLHYVLVGGFVFPLLAAAYYWMPHMTGRMPSETLGRWAFWLIFIGFNATFFIMHFTGLMGMPRRIYTYPEAFGWDLVNTISSAGAFVMAAGFALFLVDIVLHSRFGRTALRDPWKAGTLEWAMPTPPPLYNFASLPEVASRDPLWDDKGLGADIAGGRHYLAGSPRGQQETLAVDAVRARPQYVIVLPGPSWLPFLAAVAMGIFFVSFLRSTYVPAAAGAILATVLFIAWAWKGGTRSDPGDIPVGKGLFLPSHFVVRDAPGWWGTRFLLIADGTMLASLLFGYLFLWTAGPNWPPPAFIDPGIVIPVLVVGGLALAWVASLVAVRRNAAGKGRGAIMALLASAAGSLVAMAAFGAVPVVLIDSPTTHAYDASVTILALYAAFHCAISALISGFVAARVAAGFTSPRRTLEPRVAQLWAAYGAIAGSIVAIALFFLPLA